MRRALPLLLLLTANAFAAGHTHLATAAHTHTFIPAFPVHTHAPTVFPRLNLEQSVAAHTANFRENSLATFFVRTLLGFSTHSSH